MTGQSGGQYKCDRRGIRVGRLRKVHRAGDRPIENRGRQQRLEARHHLRIERPGNGRAAAAPPTRARSVARPSPAAGPPAARPLRCRRDRLRVEHVQHQRLEPLRPLRRSAAASSSLRIPAKTFRPAASSRRTVTRPIPDEAPVTRMVFMARGYGEAGGADQTEQASPVIFRQAPLRSRSRFACVRPTPPPIRRGAALPSPPRR